VPHHLASQAQQFSAVPVRQLVVAYIAGGLVDYLSRDNMAQVEHGLSRYFRLFR